MYTWHMAILKNPIWLPPEVDRHGHLLKLIAITYSNHTKSLALLSVEVEKKEEWPMVNKY